MGFGSLQVFLILGLLATSCIAQAPGAAPTQPPKSSAPVPAPAPSTATPPSNSPAQAPSPSGSSPPPPAPGPAGPASGPGSEPPPSAVPPSAAFSISNTFVAATALVGTLVAMITLA